MDPEFLKRLGLSIARGVPQMATGFVDLAALPFTLTGLLDEKDVVGGTEYLTQRGLLPPQQEGLLNETTEFVSSALNPAGAVKGGLLGLGMLASAKGAKAVNEVVQNRQPILDVAQKNAALPVTEGGLGLPVGNLPLERAAALGFDVDTPLYRGHTFGSGRNPYTFYATNPKLADQYANRGGDAQYEITNRGDRYLFDSYSDAKRAQKNDVGGTIRKLNNAPQVQSDLLQMKNPLIIDAKKGNFNFLENPFADPESVKAMNKELANVKKDLIIMGRPYNKAEQKEDILKSYYFQNFGDTNFLAEEAKKRGFDSVVIKNVYDIVGDIKGNPEDYLSDVVISLRPEQVRSRFAAFDPSKRNVADALAGIGAAGVGLGLLSPSQEEDQF